MIWEFWDMVSKYRYQ